MKIQACCTKISLNHLDQIQQAIALKNISKLEYVELNLHVRNFEEGYGYFFHDLSYHPNLQMNLNQVIKKLGPELRRFSVFYKDEL
jgi:hypothetical protein